MSKIDRIIDLLETRIARGDYAMTLFPTEHGLAEEMEVGRMTARRAILRLVEKGLIERDSSGRMSVTVQRTEQRPLLIGFVTATLSPAALHWQTVVETKVAQVGGHLRTVPFVSWDDPTLLEATDSFDGIFLVPPPEPLTEAFAERLQLGRARIVVVGADFSSQGIRGIENVAPGSVEALLEHLKSLGHQRISAFNTFTLVPAIEERLEQWNSWQLKTGLGGELINEPCAPRLDSREAAYELATRRITSGEGFGGTAVLCTTLPMGLGLIRAMNENGLEVGRDLSVCVVNDEGMAPFLNPTLTSTQLADPTPHLQEAIQWMAGGDWEGPLLKCTCEVNLFKGGSTVAPQMQMVVK